MRPIAASFLLALSAGALIAARSATAPAVPFPLVERFETFGVAEGLPAWKVHSVLAEGGRVWAGTTKGLALREGGRFRTIGTEQGLSHGVVTSLALDPATGDVWAGTFRGVSRISAGKVESFTQTSSGLPNDVVYAVLVAKGAVWAATAAGLGRFDLKTRSWSLWDHTNSIMHEPWVYSIAESPDRIWVGVWAGGVLEHDPVKGTFKEYRDPDGEMELDLLPDDGPVHDVTSWVSWSDGLLWQASYFGVARYDGSRWKTFLKDKSPLLSNFVNFIAAKGKAAWICTDQGVSVTDGETWANYRRGAAGEGLLDLVAAGGGTASRKTAGALPTGFVLGASVADDDVWLATSHGLVRGTFGRSTR